MAARKAQKTYKHPIEDAVLALTARIKAMEPGTASLAELRQMERKLAEAAQEIEQLQRELERDAGAFNKMRKHIEGVIAALTEAVARHGR